MLWEAVITRRGQLSQMITIGLYFSMGNRKGYDSPLPSTGTVAKPGTTPRVGRMFQLTSTGSIQLNGVFSSFCSFITGVGRRQEKQNEINYTRGHAFQNPGQQRPPQDSLEVGRRLPTRSRWTLQGLSCRSPSVPVRSPERRVGGHQERPKLKERAWPADQSIVLITFRRVAFTPHVSVGPCRRPLASCDAFASTETAGN